MATRPNPLFQRTISGARDYAIIRLASSTGMRAIDIANLKFGNINCTEKTISFIQHKTMSGNAIPIDDDTLGVIDEYIRVRPQCDEPYIFLTSVLPYRKLNDISSIRNILVKHMRLSGIKKSSWDRK